MSVAVLAWVVLVSCTLAMVIVAVRRIAVPLVACLTVALGLRLVFAILTSQRYTPPDVTEYFRRTGELVLQGQDPLQFMPGRQWNFLPLMPFVHALEIKTGLPWVYAVKIAPILCDVVIVWLIWRVAPVGGPTRALQYALNPLSLLVVSLHGQVEPVALALGVAGVLMAQRARWLLAGLLVGGAIAAKTWPVLIALAVIPISQPRSALRFVAGAAVLPILLLLGGAAVIGMQPVAALQHIASYSSFVRRWTWSGTLVEAGDVAGGYGSSVGRLGGILVLLASIAGVIAFRRHPPAVRAMVVLCIALVCTAGFGVQYLLWPLPLMFAVGGSRRLAYTVAAAAWAGIFYLSPWQSTDSYLIGMSWLIVLLLVYIIADAWSADDGDLEGSPVHGRAPADRVAAVTSRSART